MTNTTLDHLIQQIEDAGFDWALGREAGSYYAAVERAPCNYIGDYLSGPGAASGETPLAALAAAFASVRL